MRRRKPVRPEPPIQVEREELHYLPIAKLIELLENQKREQVRYVDHELARLRRAQEMAN